MPSSMWLSTSLRRTVAVVALLNLAYFGIEFAVALSIGSVSLFADSVDFLEDTSVNLLIFAALAWSPQLRARVGMLLSAILLVPALALLWSLWGKFSHPVPPEPFALSLTGLGALLVNLSCALMLARSTATARSRRRWPAASRPSSASTVPPWLASAMTPVPMANIITAQT